MTKCSFAEFFTKQICDLKTVCDRNICDLRKLICQAFNASLSEILNSSASLQAAANVETAAA